MPSEHEAHEQRLAAALRDLVRQIDINDYRDSLGHVAQHNAAFLKAQAVVDEFDLTHEQLCATLDGCAPDTDWLAIARQLGAGRQGRAASPGSTPPEYRTWHTGP